MIDTLYLFIEYSLLPLSLYAIFTYPFYSILFYIGISLLNYYKTDNREIFEKYPPLNFYQWSQQHKQKWIQNIIKNKDNIEDLYKDIIKHDIIKYLNKIETNLEFWKYSEFKEDIDNGKQKYIEYIHNHLQNKNKDNIFIIELVIAYYYITYYGILNNKKEYDILKEMHYAYCCILSNYKGKNSYVKYQYLYDNIDNIEESQLNIYKKYLLSQHI